MKIDEKFLKNVIFSDMSEVEYKEYIKYLVNNSFINLKKIIEIYYKPIYICFKDDPNVKTIHANYNQQRIDWNESALYNDVLIIMNILYVDNVEITKDIFEQIVIMIMACEISKLLNDDYEKICKLKYDIVKESIYEYYDTMNENINPDRKAFVRDCVISSINDKIYHFFQEQKIEFEKKAWKNTRKFLVQGKSNFINQKLFDRVRDICINKYECLTLLELYEIEFDLLKDIILENKYSSEVIKIILATIQYEEHDDMIAVDLDGYIKNNINRKNTGINIIFEFISKAIYNFNSYLLSLFGIDRA